MYILFVSYINVLSIPLHLRFEKKTFRLIKINLYIIIDKIYEEMFKNISILFRYRVLKIATTQNFRNVNLNQKQLNH